MATLVDTFDELLAQHDLKSIAFSARPAGAYRYGVTVHWDGFARDGNPCESGMGCDLNAALVDALNKTRNQRTPIDNVPDAAAATVDLAA